jgi:hypothetical protein
LEKERFNSVWQTNNHQQVDHTTINLCTDYFTFARRTLFKWYLKDIIKFWVIFIPGEKLCISILEWPSAISSDLFRFSLDSAFFYLKPLTSSERLIAMPISKKLSIHWAGNFCNNVWTILNLVLPLKKWTSMKVLCFFI